MSINDRIQSNKQNQNESSIFEGFGGFVNHGKWSFFTAPAWVDLKKQPGTTPLAPVLQNTPNWKEICSGLFLFYSPNLPWLVIALFMYYFTPYNLSNEFTMKKWFFNRLPINLIMTFGYFGFWHFSLYFLNWGKRPFNAKRKYKWSKSIHNCFYTLCGTIQYTVWETLIIYGYISGRLPFINDEESFSSFWSILKFVSWFWLVPIWRGLHFYFAHRFIHMKSLYKYVHSVHHRNTDIEPFAGLSMHPIEHLYYFSVLGIVVYLRATPFALLWTGVHVMLAPAASHSGFEDHFQADQFHYAHHRFFECNYGDTMFVFDRIFGTFRDQLKEDSNTYNGEHKPDGKTVKLDATTAARADAKANLYSFPSKDQFVYNLLTCIFLPMLLYYTLNSETIQSYKKSISFVMSFGPIIIASILYSFTSNSFSWRSFVYPFHKELFFGKFGFHLVIATVFSVLPVYHTVLMIVSKPGEYFVFF